MLLKQSAFVGFYFALLRRTLITAQVNMTSAPAVLTEGSVPGSDIRVTFIKFVDVSEDRRADALTKVVSETLQKFDYKEKIIEMFSVAYITVPDMDIAKKIASGLVKSKLAACVNIIPGITSIYEWKGEINEDSELLLMVKTRTSKVNALTDFVRSNHPYEVCEVISLPIHNGNPPYLKWIKDTVPEK